MFSRGLSVRDVGRGSTIQIRPDAPHPAAASIGWGLHRSADVFVMSVTKPSFPRQGWSARMLENAGILG